MRVREHSEGGLCMRRSIWLINMAPIVLDGSIEGFQTGLSTPDKSLLQLSNLGGRVTETRPPGTLATTWCRSEPCRQGCSRNVQCTLIYTGPLSWLSFSASLSYSRSSLSGEPAGFLLLHIPSLQQSISESHPSIC